MCFEIPSSADFPLKKGWEIGTMISIDVYSDLNPNKVTLFFH